ncbi:MULTISPECIES: DinB family protein [Niastella]|uniref:DinB-like domain-containing protein n=1 Tax=Niastella soli TaxID=2821487 RepID=A0ABS3YXU8_9BACT|nr:DinB family protein [Niastella soli]MBO9202573.1 hypothetical protein [Niastella soli]
MQEDIRSILWYQFGAAIDMLENAMVVCADHLWNSDTQFWYMAYHTLFYLDYYVSEDPDGFMPPVPFTLSEFDPNGALPDRVYGKEELLNYLAYGRKKLFDRIMNLSETGEGKRFTNERRDYSAVEILLYNMRHVQHHTAQLNLLLRQGMNEAPGWVSRTNK